jgi:septal ring factor EnvC (AmiA/AmiB activator)
LNTMLRPTVAMLLMLHGAVQAQNPEQEQQLQALVANIKSIQEELASRGEERSGVWQEIQASEQAIASLQDQIRATSLQIDTTSRQLADLREQAGALQRSISAQQLQLASYIRGAWQNGQQEYLKLLLTQQDPASSARMLRYYGYFSSARAARISEFRQSLADLVSLETEIEAANAALISQQQQLQDQDTRLQAGQAARQQMLDELDIVLAERGQKLERLEFERVEVELLLAELRRAVTDLSPPEGADQPFAAMKGQLDWPLQGRLANSFGARHELGDLTWEGINIEAAGGTAIKAVHPGRVVFSGWFGNSGLLLIIDHGDGYMSLYAHNQALSRTVGDWVTAGEVIASTGNTGGQKKPGLYFEIRRNGVAENPVSWLKRQ